MVGRRDVMGGGIPAGLAAMVSPEEVVLRTEQSANFIGLGYDAR